MWPFNRATIFKEYFMAIIYVDQVDLKDKNIIARFDFNVPLAKDGSGKISDTTRIDRALETINTILEQQPKKLIMMSHLGRPKGEIKPEFSLRPVAEYLSEKLERDITLTETCLDSGIKTLLNLNDNNIILLENVRFHKEETKNDPFFAQTLASYADYYVLDAFGTAHRKHASTYGIMKYFPPGHCLAGLLMKKEIEALTKVVENPQKPFISIVGGAKVSDKIKIIERLLTTSDRLLIGGAMAYPFLKAKGHQIGTSLCDEADVKLAKEIISADQYKKLELPCDHQASKEFGGSKELIDAIDIPDDMMGLDIGPKTIKRYEDILQTARTVLWNGPMGLFENSNYAAGTISIANLLAKLDAFTVIGGGDSVSAVTQAGVADKMGHVSTGGGASLEFLEQGTLPGIKALRFGIND